MAGDWMKVEKITPDKPEIEAMASILDLDPDAVFGKCFRVWRWFDDHTTDGNALSVTKSSIDRRVCVAGFADAMQSVGWLVVSPEGVMLPKFDVHNGETSKTRALTAKRAAKHRASSNGGVTVDASRNAHLEKRREEKRREEKEEEKSAFFSPDKNPEKPGTEVGDSLTFLEPNGKLAEKFWQSYPKKTQRGQLDKALDAAIHRVRVRHSCTDNEAYSWILAAAMEFAMSPMGNSPPDKLPAPVKWLEDERYHDDRALWRKNLGERSPLTAAKPKMQPLKRENRDDGDTLMEMMK